MTSPDGAGEDSSSAAIKGTKTIEYQPHEFLVLTIDGGLRPGKYTWACDFEGTLKKGGNGLYLSTYKDESGKER